MSAQTAQRSHRAQGFALLGTLLSLTAAVLVAAAVVVVLVLPRAVKGEAMTVLTGSMEPSIPTGSIALVRPVDPRAVAIGDVITYQVRPDEEVYVTHRVVDIRERRGQTWYVLKGDANDATDDPILADRIRGEVWFHVPYLGTVRDGLRGRGGVYLLATLLLAWFSISQVSGGLRERRVERHPSVPADRELTLECPTLLVRLEAPDSADLDDLLQRIDDLGPVVTVHLAGPGDVVRLPEPLVQTHRTSRA